jgi:AbrB family looped-hinge helix DNA binding protein
MGAIKVSKLTEKYQATVPAEIRKALKLVKGDHITFEVLDDLSVVVRKASRSDQEWSRALEGTLNEWSSAHDERAYRDL